MLKWRSFWTSIRWSIRSNALLKSNNTALTVAPFPSVALHHACVILISTFVALDPGVILELLQTSIFIRPCDLLLVLLWDWVLFVLCHRLFRSPVTDRVWRPTGSLWPGDSTKLPWMTQHHTHHVLESVQGSVQEWTSWSTRLCLRQFSEVLLQHSFITLCSQKPLRSDRIVFQRSKF